METISKNNLVTIDFTTPIKLNLDDKVSLRDVYEKLVERGGYTGTNPFNTWVRKKLKFYQEGVDYSSQTTKTLSGKGASGVQTSIEYYTSIQVAMEIAANGHGKVGHEMRQFMSSCVRKLVENGTVTSLPGSVSAQLFIAAQEVKTLETKLTLVNDQLSTSKICESHVKALQSAMASRRELEGGLPVEINGFFQQALKNHFGLNATSTFKDLALKDFPEAITFISRWPICKAAYAKAEALKVKKIDAARAKKVKKSEKQLSLK